MPSTTDHECSIALLCSDLHLSHRPPPCRAGEDWYKAQQRVLDEIWTISMEEGGIPIVCAGDIFDRWNSPPELINFALGHLPDMYTIPGQHDLPYHRYEDIEKSAYTTLVKAGKIQHLPYGEPIRFNQTSLVMYGFGWERPIDNTLIDRAKYPDHVHLAVVHAYIWDSPSTGYVGVSEEKKLPRYFSPLSGFDAAVFGDNHKGFLWQDRGGDKPLSILNNGGMMRRKSDERDYRPGIGILYNTGRIERRYLDISQDSFEEATIIVEGAKIDISGVVEELMNLTSDRLDFQSAVKEFLDRTGASESVRRLLMETIGVFK